MCNQPYWITAAFEARADLIFVKQGYKNNKIEDSKRQIKITTGVCVRKFHSIYCYFNWSLAVLVCVHEYALTRTITEFGVWRVVGEGYILSLEVFGFFFLLFIINFHH